MIVELCLRVGRVVERAAIWKQGKVLRVLEREHGVTAEGQRVVCMQGAGIYLVTFGAHWEKEELGQGGWWPAGGPQRQLCGLRICMGVMGCPCPVCLRFLRARLAAR